MINKKIRNFAIILCLCTVLCPLNVMAEAEPEQKTIFDVLDQPPTEEQMEFLLNDENYRFNDFTAPEGLETAKIAIFPFSMTDYEFRWKPYKDDGGRLKDEEEYFALVGKNSEKGYYHIVAGPGRRLAQAIDSEIFDGLLNRANIITVGGKNLTVDKAKFYYVTLASPEGSIHMEIHIVVCETEAGRYMMWENGGYQIYHGDKSKRKRIYIHSEEQFMAYLTDYVCFEGHHWGLEEHINEHYGKVKNNDDADKNNGDNKILYTVLISAGAVLVVGAVVVIVIIARKKKTAEKDVKTVPDEE